MNTDIRVNGALRAINPCPRKWRFPMRFAIGITPSVAKNHPIRDSRGIALIIALGLLALITVMFLGYTASMKSQRFQSKNYNDAVQARMLAMSAVDRAMALIGNNAPVRGLAPPPAPPGTWNTWYSGPGLINKNANATPNYLYQNTGTLPATGPLLSDAPSGGVPTGLNQPLSSGGDYDIVPNIGTVATPIYADAKLDVYWINVGKDPSSAITPLTNPLAARYAFWVDDEAAKINLNYANLRSFSGRLSTHRIDLTPLYVKTDGTSKLASGGTGIDSILNTADIAQAVYGLNTPPDTYPDSGLALFRPYETLQELGRTPDSQIGYATWPDIARVNRFFTTVYSWDDNKNFAGALRRDITSLVTIPAGANDFEDSDISPGVPSLYKLMMNSTASPWSLIFPTSQVVSAKDNFEKKYGASTVTLPGLQQIVANIIDYQKVATVDSTYLDITSNGNTPPGDVRNTPKDGVLGLRKTPYINEVAANSEYKSTSPPGPGGPYTVTITVDVVVELINPFNTPLGGGYEVVVQMGDNPTLTGATWTTPPTWNPPTTQTKTIAAVAAHGYVTTGKMTFTAQGISSTDVNAPQTLAFTIDNVRLLVTASNAATIRDFAGNPLQTLSFSLVCNPGGPPPPKYKSYSRNDPRCRYMAGPSDDTLGPGNSLQGEVNAGVVTGFNNAPDGTQAVANSPTPPYPLVADFMFMGPAANFDPKNMDTGNPNTSTCYIKELPMDSIGELGRIHTGYQWRTLRLQPRLVPNGAPAQAAELDSIPDWAILDLLRIPAIENDAANNRVQGRININQKINAASTGFATGGAAPTNFRERPVVALLKGWAAPSKYDQIPSVAGHLDYDIYHEDLRPPANKFGGFGFDSIGEICEVGSLQYGFSSGGGSPGNDAQQEEVIRGIANLITTRSNVFTVWAVAQTVQDVNKSGTFEANTDIITSEQKIMAVVERYEDATGKVRFRIKYLKYLTD